MGDPSPRLHRCSGTLATLECADDGIHALDARNGVTRYRSMECALIIDVKPRVSDVFDQVWRTLAVLFVWDVLITIIYYVLPFRA